MKIIQKLTEALKCSDEEIKRLLSISTPTLIKYKKGVTEKEVIRILKKILTQQKLDGKQFMENLRSRFHANTNLDLAIELGLTQQAFYQYEKKPIGVKEVATLIRKAREHFAQNAIKPIIEFYPITKSATTHGAQSEIIDASKNSKRGQKIRELLRKKHGIYLFYNSQGKLLYIGKAEKTHLWQEIKNAYNRTRADQKIYSVNHPTTGSSFEPAFKAPRQIKKISFKLHDLAAYFSAYEVEDALVHHLEAAIIRMVPNDNLNAKIEKIVISRV